MYSHSNNDKKQKLLLQHIKILFPREAVNKDCTQACRFQCILTINSINGRSTLQAYGPAQASKNSTHPNQPHDKCQPTLNLPVGTKKTMTCTPLTLGSEMRVSAPGQQAALKLKMKEDAMLDKSPCLWFTLLYLDWCYVHQVTLMDSFLYLQQDGAVRLKCLVLFPCEYDYYMHNMP